MILLYLFWILAKLCFILILYSNLVYSKEINVKNFYTVTINSVFQLMIDINNSRERREKE